MCWVASPSLFLFWDRIKLTRLDLILGSLFLSLPECWEYKRVPQCSVQNSYFYIFNDNETLLVQLGIYWGLMSHKDIYKICKIIKLCKNIYKIIKMRKDVNHQHWENVNQNHSRYHFTPRMSIIEKIDKLYVVVHIWSPTRRLRQKR